MRAPAKLGLVAAGYVAAVLIAWVAVTLYISLTSGVDRQAASGMTAFGDSLVFLAVFGVAALLPTGAALVFLRPYRVFWTLLSAAALLVAATGVVAAVDYAMDHAANGSGLLGRWSAVSVLRILIAPLLTLSELLSALIAPNRSARIGLALAALVEGAAFASAALVLILFRA